MRVSIPFIVKETEDGSFHPIVQAEVDGRGIFLIIDTGASRTVLDKSIVTSHAVLENKNQEVFAAGINAQRLEVAQVVIHQLKFGNIIFSDLVVFSTDLKPVSDLFEEMGQSPIDGLLGCDFLYSNNATINFKKKVITLDKPQHKELQPKEKINQP